MHNKIIFGKWEATWLVTNMITTKILLNFARAMEETAGTAAWILSIYLFILANIGFFFISKLFKRFPSKDIIDISSEIGGITLRLLVGIITLLSLLFIDLLYLREFSENMKVIALTTSPLSYVMLFFIIGIITACFLGLEAITRLHAVGIPILVLAFVIVGSMSIKYWDLSYALPILGLGLDEIFINGSLNLSNYTELIFLFFLPPFLVSFKVFKTVGYRSIIIAGTALTGFTLSYILSFPYPVDTESFLPVYRMTRVIEYGRFIQRIEPLFLILWSSSALFLLSTSVYFTIYTFKKMFNLPYIRPLIIPFVIIAFNLAFIPKSLAETVYRYVDFFYHYSWIVTFVVPILLLITAVAFKKGGKQNA